MKIRNVLLIMLLMLKISTSAQFTSCKVEEIEKLKQGTVIVAISDDETINKSVEEIMKSYWTVSKYNLIKKSTLDDYVKANPENFILTYVMNNDVLVTAIPNSNASKGPKLRSRVIGDGLALTKDLKKVKKLDPFRAMAYCFISSDLLEVNKDAEFIREVSSINSVLSIPGLKDEQLGKWKIPTIDQKEIITKELWVPNKFLEYDYTEELFAKDMKTYEPYKCKKVSYEEIAKAIIDRRKDISYMTIEEFEAGKNVTLIHAGGDSRVLFLVTGFSIYKKIKENKPYGQ